MRTFLIGFFFNRGGGRVLGLDRKGLMTWLMVVKIVGFKLPSHIEKSWYLDFQFHSGWGGDFFNRLFFNKRWIDVTY